MYSESWSGWSSWSLVASMQILCCTGRLWAGGTCRWNSRRLGRRQIPFEWSVPPPMAAQKPEECVVWGQNAIIVVAYGLMFATRLQWKAGGCWDIAIGRHWNLSVLGTLKNIFLADTVGWWLVGWERFHLPTSLNFFQRLRHSTFHDVPHNLQNCWSRMTLTPTFLKVSFFWGDDHVWPWVAPCPLTLAALGEWTEILSSLIMLILLGTCYVAARESMMPGWICIQPHHWKRRSKNCVKAGNMETTNYCTCIAPRPGNLILGVSSVSLIQKWTSRKKMMHTGTVTNLEDPWMDYQPGWVWWVSTDVDLMVFEDP